MVLSRSSSRARSGSHGAPLLASFGGTVSLLAESQRNRHTSFGPADPLGPASAGHVADHGPAHTLSHPWLSVPPAAVRYDAAKEERQQQEAKQRELQRVEEALQAAARRGKTVTLPTTPPRLTHNTELGMEVRPEDGWMEGGAIERLCGLTPAVCVSVCASSTCCFCRQRLKLKTCSLVWRRLCTRTRNHTTVTQCDTSPLCVCSAVQCSPLCVGLLSH